MRLVVTFTVSLRTSENAHTVEDAVTAALEQVMPEAIATNLGDEDLVVAVDVTDVTDEDGDEDDDEDEDEDFGEDD